MRAGHDATTFRRITDPNSRGVSEKKFREAVMDEADRRLAACEEGNNLGRIARELHATRPIGKLPAVLEGQHLD